jgi:hypothetical protein
MKKLLNLLVFSSLTTLPFSTAFPVLPPAFAKHQAMCRESTHLYNNDYDSMSMGELQKIVTNEKGYEVQGVDRTGLIMIAKGWGSTVRGARLLQDRHLVEDEAAMLKVKRDESALSRAAEASRYQAQENARIQAAEASRYQAQENARIQASNQAGNQASSGIGYGDMSTAELTIIAQEKGYDPQGVERAGLIMIAKGHGHSVRGARTLQDKFQMENETSERNERSLAQAEAARYQAQENERIQAREIAARDKVQVPDYASMSIDELRKYANERGYDDQGVNRTGLIMIAKGWGRSVRSARLLQDPMESEDRPPRGAQTPQYRSQSEERPERGGRTPQPRSQWEDQASRMQSDRAGRAQAQPEASRENTPFLAREQAFRSSVPDYDRMSMPELKQLANEIGYDSQGLDRTGLIMIAKGMGRHVRGARSLQHRLQWEDHESRMQTKLVEHSQAQAEVASYQARENTRLQAGYDQDVLRASEQDHIRSNEASNQNMLRASEQDHIRPNEASNQNMLRASEQDYFRSNEASNQDILRASEQDHIRPNETSNQDILRASEQDHSRSNEFSNQDILRASEQDHSRSNEASSTRFKPNTNPVNNGSESKKEPIWHDFHKDKNRKIDPNSPY